jgi:hypothetical protein
LEERWPVAGRERRIVGSLLRWFEEPMQRRNVLAVTGALGAVVVAAVIAVAANVGLFGLTRDEGGPGHLRLVTDVTVVATPGTQPGSTTSTTFVKRDGDDKAPHGDD